MTHYIRNLPTTASFLELQWDTKPTSLDTSTSPQP
jgi:hypothetical protein